MSIQQVNAEQAHALMTQDPSIIYLDVRTVPEFEAGHPPAALNIPVVVPDPAVRKMAPNPDFLSVVAKTFPPDARLVVGCKAGGRSLRAATLLEGEGYAHVVDQKCGFDGAAQPGGRPEPGWRHRGLPVATKAAPERTYEHLKARPGR